MKTAKCFVTTVLFYAITFTGAQAWIASPVTTDPLVRMPGTHATTGKQRRHRGPDPLPELSRRIRLGR